MNRLGRLTHLVGLNAVPIAGLMWAGWSDGTALALYWCETLITLFLVALRIRIHRKLTNKRGHFTGPNSYFSEQFLYVGLGFLLGPGIFVGIAAGNAHIDAHALGRGMLYSSGFLLVGLLLDLTTIRDQPFMSIRKIATPEKIFDAIRSVRAEDILFFRTMIAIRRGFRGGKESILNPARNAAILDVATRTGFDYLANDPPREVVVGICVAPDVFAAMNFLVAGDGIVSTETRVHAKTARARRRFALYWFVIRPGSGFIRRMWLRAIRIRAERDPISTEPSPRSAGRRWPKAG